MGVWSAYNAQHDKSRTETNIENLNIAITSGICRSTCAIQQTKST